MKNYFIALSLFAATAATFVACKKDKADNGSTSLVIRMGDDPINAEEVNIDLKEVRIKFDEDAWYTVATHQGIYNLLKYQNGVDTAIAQGTFPRRMVKEIRLIVGDKNTIKVGGIYYPLTIPSGSESGLKIKVDKDLRSDVETLLLDFDAALSIKQENDGYKLRPVVRLR